MSIENKMWCVEWSPGEEKQGRYPFHIDLMDNSLRKNQDLYLRRVEGSPWVILFAATSGELCYKFLEDVQKWPRK